LILTVVLAPTRAPVKDVFVDVAEGFFDSRKTGKKTDAKGGLRVTGVPLGKHDIKLFKSKLGPVPANEDDAFVPDFTVIQAFTFTPGDNVVEMEMSDGTGTLRVDVTQADAKPLDDCDVEVLGQNSGTTPANGILTFTGVKTGDQTIKVFKAGFGPVPTGSDPVRLGELVITAEANNPKRTRVSAGRTKTVAATLVPATGTVKKLRALVEGTKSLRTPANKLADNRLKDSTTNDESLATNAPTVLVRGGNPIQFTVETDPADQPVGWRVKQDGKSVRSPTLTEKEGGKKAELNIDRPGAFTVIAARGVSRIAWNVVLVSVVVKEKTTAVVKRSNTYQDNGSDNTRTRFKSGDFVQGREAFEVTVDVELIGGGADKKLGVDKVDLHSMQNGTADTLRGDYDSGGVALEQVFQVGGINLLVPGFPILDNSGPGAAVPVTLPAIPSAGPAFAPVPFGPLTSTATPFAVTAGVFKLTALEPGPKPRKFRILFMDSPTGSFVKKHATKPPPGGGALLRTVSGVNSFRTAVTATSQDAPNCIVAHAQIDWTADYAGKVDYPAPGNTGIYTRTTGGTKVAANRYQLIRPAQGGQEAAAAGFECFEPRFNNSVKSQPQP
jgi:hypothetical protein